MPAAPCRPRVLSRQLIRRAAPVLAVWLLAAPAAAVCPGDCDGDMVVAVNEVIKGVNIALGQSPLTDCPAIDRNGNGVVTIDELLAAVNALLGGCPPVLSPTPAATGT